MGKVVGKRIKLSPARKVINEMLRHAKLVPTVPVARCMEITDVAQLRKTWPEPPSWTTIFLRAYALVCHSRPPLRRVHMPFPFAHLYEHPETSCRIAIEREHQGEQVPFLALIKRPHEMSLEQIQTTIRQLKEVDLWSNGNFRKIIRLGRLPSPLRKIAMWDTLYLSGPRRVRRGGTFGVSNYGSLGAESLHPIAPTTTVLTLGPIQNNESVTAKLVYDHRVLDGAYVARSLAHLQEILDSEIVRELRTRQNSHEANMRAA